MLVSSFGNALQSVLLFYTFFVCSNAAVLGAVGLLQSLQHLHRDIILPGGVHFCAAAAFVPRPAGDDAVFSWGSFRRAAAWFRSSWWCVSQHSSSALLLQQSLKLLGPNLQRWYLVLVRLGRLAVYGRKLPTLAAVGCSGAQFPQQQQCVGIHQALCSLAAAAVSWFVLGASFGPLQTGLWLGVVGSALLCCQPAVRMHSCSLSQSQFLPAVVMPSCLLFHCLPFCILLLCAWFGGGPGGLCSACMCSSRTSVCMMPVLTWQLVPYMLACLW